MTGDASVLGSLHSVDGEASCGGKIASTQGSTASGERSPIPIDSQLAARLDGRHLDEPTPHTVSYSVGDNRMEITLDDGARSSLWWATKNEWLGLLDVAGLELDALYGGFADEPFSDDSREYVFVARR